ASPELQVSQYGISYLADAIVLLRYMELAGELRKTVGMLKKRTGDFEKTLRELAITDHGVQVGRPLSGLRGILSGIPEILEENRAHDVARAR
ncbi:ATPase domain-containing protein, partial [Salinisphaera sp. RV14]